MANALYTFSAMYSIHKYIVFIYNTDRLAILKRELSFQLTFDAHVLLLWLGFYILLNHGRGNSSRKDDKK